MTFEPLYDGRNGTQLIRRDETIYMPHFEYEHLILLKYDFTLNGRFSVGIDGLAKDITANAAHFCDVIRSRTISQCVDWRQPSRRHGLYV